MRRVLRAVAAGSVAAVVLAGCGGSSKSASQKAAEKVANDVKSGNTKNLQQDIQTSAALDTTRGDPCKIV